MVYIDEFAAVIDYVISKEEKLLMSEYQNSIFALVSQQEEMKGERWKEKFDSIIYISRKRGKLHIKPWEEKVP